MNNLVCTYESLQSAGVQLKHMPDVGGAIDIVRGRQEDIKKQES